MQKILVLDTETTGIRNHPIHKRPEVIELSYMDISGELDEFRVLAEMPKEVVVETTINTSNKCTITERFKPSMAIEDDAFRIHKINMKMLQGCRSSEEAKIPEDIDYILGHNIQYDHRCLGKPDVRLLCTQKFAKIVSKNGLTTFEDHKLSTILSHFYKDHEATILNPVHTSAGDVVKTILVFVALLKYFPGLKSWDELYNFQNMGK
ncbi:MAG TPA: hypothetical protein PLS71_25240 [Leptospiraceae bacterium]|nr:hypothetical protein [Leptospiraceae bacterium]